MGDRSTIELRYGKKYQSEDTYPPLYLYSHWGGSALPVVLAAALDRGRERWSDTSYLARIIATDVFRDADFDSLTGAGLSPFPIEHVGVIVDLDAKTVTIGEHFGGDYSELFVDAFPEGKVFSFEEYIAKIQVFRTTE